MARFRVGQEVICIIDENGWCDRAGRKVDGPQKDELVTVVGIPENEPDAIFVSGYSCDEGYQEDYFEEIMSTSVLEQELETIAIER